MQHASQRSHKQDSDQGIAGKKNIKNFEDDQMMVNFCACDGFFTQSND